MNELIWVAAITTIGTLLGATVGTLASIFGPAWHERKAREAAEDRARDDVRFQRAQATVEAISNYYYATNQFDHASIEAVRMGFVATLRPGEGQADTFTRDLLNAADNDRRRSIVIASAGASLLFAWLRGDEPIARLTIENALGESQTK